MISSPAVVQSDYQRADHTNDRLPLGQSDRFRDAEYFRRHTLEKVTDRRVDLHVLRFDTEVSCDRSESIQRHAKLRSHFESTLVAAAMT